MKPVFYKKIVPLNKLAHRQLSIESLKDYQFAAQANSLSIALIEFPKAVFEYPILFAQDNENSIFPVALLGLQSQQNLFIDETGQWQADYIPAYARRYPFILATDSAENEKFTVCIDESYPGFNSVNNGQALFDDAGQENTVLTQAIDFLKDYNSHIVLTRQFCKNLQDMDILEPMQANIEMKTGKKLSISGFYCVNRGKLQNLSLEQQQELIKSEQMEFIYYHLLSLNNIERLMNKLA